MSASPAWFKEPTERDPTYANHGESPFEWLRRSTIERAAACRKFLNSNLASLPHEIQESLFHDLEHRWDSAFFELIVARTLQELGGDVEYEQEQRDGKRPDFKAIFPDCSIIVEATVPEVNKGSIQDYENAQPLLSIIEQFRPIGWHIIAWALPEIGPNDSKKKFKSDVSKLFEKLEIIESDKLLDISTDVSDGWLSMSLFRSHGTNGRGTEPAISYMDDTEIRIRRSYQMKKRQVRNSDLPVILAIGCAGANLEDFDTALLGSTAAFTDIITNRGTVAHAFELSGEWTRRKPRFKPPAIDGLLAFTRFGFSSTLAPTLYHHPRSAAELPSSLLTLRRRYFGIGNIDSTNSDLMSNINSVDFGDLPPSSV